MRKRKNSELATTINTKLSLKLVVFLFQGFAQSGFVYVMMTAPILTTAMIVFTFGSYAILAWSLFYLLGGVKAIRNWWAREVYKGKEKARIRAEIKHRVLQEEAMKYGQIQNPMDQGRK